MSSLTATIALHLTTVRETSGASLSYQVSRMRRQQFFAWPEAIADEACDLLLGQPVPGIDDTLGKRRSGQTRADQFVFWTSSRYGKGRATSFSIDSFPSNRGAPTLTRTVFRWEIRMRLPKVINGHSVTDYILIVAVATGSLTIRSSPGLAQGFSVSNRSIRPFVTGFVPVVGPRGAVGGVSVDAHGVVKNVDPKYQRELTELKRAAFAKLPPNMATQSGLRKVSLRHIEQSVVEALAGGDPIPDSIQYLGGLTRIRYVFVYPEERDVVLAGPSEPLMMDANGNVVGTHSGQPVLQLEDLLVALRNVESARSEAISCSIDSKPEGIRRFRAFMRKQRQFSRAVVAGIKKSLGPHVVTFKSVPADSHFARVLFASDYRMKRIAMKLENSPVDGLKSYLDLLESARSVPKNVMPRWWLACNYEPLARSEDGLAWELRGPGVMAMTETDFLSSEGKAIATGRRSSLAQQWADQLTEHYGELAGRVVVFGELRNLMDLSIIAALITKEDLLGLAGLQIPHLASTARAP